MKNFDSSSSDALRANLLQIKDLDYHDFIVTSYLSSLLSDATEIKQADLDAIALLRGKFNTTQLWLEALLFKKVLVES